MPTVITQPAPLLSDNGIILSVGIVVNGDRTEIVMPMASDSAIAPLRSCADLTVAFQGGIGQSRLMDCLSSDAYLSFIQCVGMVSGAALPNRLDQTAGAVPGTRGSGPMPSRDAAIGLYYGDPAQPSPHHRVRVAKQFIMGIAQADVVGDTIVSALANAVGSFCVGMASGILDANGKTWYRVTAAVPTSGITLCNIALCNTRAYTATVRRRTLPH